MVALYPETHKWGSPRGGRILQYEKIKFLIWLYERIKVPHITVWQNKVSDKILILFIHGDNYVSCKILVNNKSLCHVNFKKIIEMLCNRIIIGGAGACPLRARENLKIYQYDRIKKHNMTDEKISFTNMTYEKIKIANMTYDRMHPYDCMNK